ncbi:MAG TPA: hypothetical protein VFY93_13310 [Planctomycetota bacterium]|nr:hypothetical protein [Planctomycetota bacterium]
MTDPSKLPRPGGPLPRSPLPTLAVRTPTAKIVVLVVLLFLVIGGMILLNHYAKTPEAQKVSNDSFAIAAPPPEMPTGVPPLDMTIAGNLTDYGTEARSRWPNEAVHYLLLEAANTPAVFSYERNLLPLTRGSAAEIDKDSRPWRFKYVRFRGQIEYLKEEPYEVVAGAPSPDQGLVWKGRVRVDDGDPPLRVVFVCVTPPMWADTNDNSPRPEAKLIEDGWVRGRGILVQNYIDPPGGDVPALLVVATEIERDFEAVPVTSLADVPFDIIRDNPSKRSSEDDRAILAKEYPRALFRLVAYAELLSGASGAEKRAEGKLVPRAIPNAKEWEKLWGNPEGVRGKYFGGLGIVVVSPDHLSPETIPANDAGVEECLNGWILTDEQKLIQFIAPITLDGPWEMRTRVKWEGFFYKMKLYAARDGTEKIAPVFVLTSLEKIVVLPSNSLFPVIVAGSVVVGLTLLAYLVLREDSTKESYRLLRRKKAAADRAAE